MNILFLHQNFPAQFVHAATAAQQAGHRCVAIVPDTNQRHRIIETITYAFAAPDKPPTEPGQDYLANVTRGQAAASAMLRLKKAGFTPDVVVGHCGWGETLFVKDIWPSSRLIVHAEFYYSSNGADFGFDPEFPSTNNLHAAIKLRTRNAGILQSITDADCGISPTQWQASRFPQEIRSKIRIIHEGIDTQKARPNLAASVRLGRDKLTLRPTDEVITFVSRNLEPYRGYHSFMRALPKVLAARPDAHVVIVGGNKASYGPSLKIGSWKDKFLSEVRPSLDMDRIHFVSTVPHALFIQLMQVSSAHVYLTYPFVLSWSMLEAMACGAVVIGSSTPPVQEVIEHRHNGLLVDFFEPEQIAEAVIEVLVDRNKQKSLRDAARNTVVGCFDLTDVALPRWKEILVGND